MVNKMKEYSEEEYNNIHEHVYPIALVNDFWFSSKSYLKDNKKCPYMHKLAGVPFCSWNCAPCERVDFESCRTFNSSEEEESND